MKRLTATLREAFPGTKGFSPHNLKYMRAFAAAWRERAIVQEALAHKSRLAQKVGGLHKKVSQTSSLFL